MAKSPGHRHLNTPEKALFHGLRNAMTVIFAGRETLELDKHVTTAVGREVLEDMKAAEAKARGSLEALAKLIR